MRHRKFHLGDILTITTGRLVSPRLMDGIYSILNFMTGDNLMTHQLIRASRICKPHLFKQMPWLEQVDASSVTPDNWKEWLKEQVTKYEKYHIVTALDPKDYQSMDPIDELLLMGVDSSKIIPVDPNDFQEGDQRPSQN